MAKVQFLDNMSHAMRTPMNAIIGLLPLLRQLAAMQVSRNLRAKQATREIATLVAGSALEAM